MTEFSIYRQPISVIPSVIMTWYDKIQAYYDKIKSIMTELYYVIPSVIMDLNRLLFHYDTWFCHTENIKRFNSFMTKASMTKLKAIMTNFEYDIILS